MEKSCLSATHLGCSRDEQLLFKPVSFQLMPGAALVVLGANGIGKTTFLRVIAGLLAPACGQLNRDLPLKKLAYLGPHNAVKGALSAREQLSLNGACAGEIDAALRQWGLSAWADKPCALLSSGQKQRVALVRILLSRAPLWILDEPMNALDKAGEQLFVEMLNAHLAQGHIAVIATHQTLVTKHMQTLSLEA